MKILSLSAAALVAIAGLSPGVALAQHRTVVERTVTHTQMRDGPGYRVHMRKVCNTRFNHGRRIRTCRMVRG